MASKGTSCTVAVFSPQMDKLLIVQEPGKPSVSLPTGQTAQSTDYLKNVNLKNFVKEQTGVRISKLLARFPNGDGQLVIAIGKECPTAVNFKDATWVTRQELQNLMSNTPCRTDLQMLFQLWTNELLEHHSRKWEKLHTSLGSWS